LSFYASLFAQAFTATVFTALADHIPTPLSLASGRYQRIGPTPSHGNGTMAFTAQTTSRSAIQQLSTFLQLVVCSIQRRPQTASCFMCCERLSGGLAGLKRCPCLNLIFLTLCCIAQWLGQHKSPGCKQLILLPITNHLVPNCPLSYSNKCRCCAANVQQTLTVATNACVLPLNTGVVSASLAGDQGFNCW
jgi:hypothetical protein